MPEIDLVVPRAWVDFVNPDDADEVFHCDLTWLTSRWTCIFGGGCHGIYRSSPSTGCCTLGAHFSGDEDHERVAGHVARLTDDLWQRRPSFQCGWTELDDEGDLKTRVADGACVFHNDADFPGGYGCALHHLAVAEGRSFVETKPDVCWQLPLRRQFREVDRGDGSTYTETSIGEYTRAGWGPGGADLDWYCSSNTEAHVSPVPVYVASRDELVAMMGEAGYAELVRHCDAFVEAGRPQPHPAD